MAWATEVSRATGETRVGRATKGAEMAQAKKKFGWAPNLTRTHQRNLKGPPPNLVAGLYTMRVWTAQPHSPERILCNWTHPNPHHIRTCVGPQLVRPRLGAREVFRQPKPETRGGCGDLCNRAWPFKTGGIINPLIFLCEAQCNQNPTRWHQIIKKI